MDLSNYLNEEFDDRSVLPSTGTPEPVPPGDYMLQLEKGEVTYTSTGTGVLFKARFAILEGEYSGRAIFAQYNVRNNNQQAQMIGIAEMKALAMVCGVDWEEARKETDLLMYKPFLAKIGMDKPSVNKTTGKEYPPRNKIMRYMPASEKKEAEVPFVHTSKVLPDPLKQPLPASGKDIGDDEVPF